jgi:hypothetical protein
MKTRIFLLSAGCLALGLTIANGLGCGGGGVNKMTVTGKVTYEGKPVELGSIEFFSQETSLTGAGNTTGVIQNGMFSVPGVTRGKNLVIVGQSEEGAPLPPGNMAERPKPPDMRNVGKVKQDFLEKAAAAKGIPRDAPGNAQTFDIGESNRDLNIAILAKKK